MMKNETSGSDKTPSFEMTWGSSTSSGYHSQDESDSEFDQYFTARTSFFPKGRKAPVSANVKKVSDWRPKGSSIKQNLFEYWCPAKQEVGTLMRCLGGVSQMYFICPSVVAVFILTAIRLLVSMLRFIRAELRF